MRTEPLRLLRSIAVGSTPKNEFPSQTVYGNTEGSDLRMITYDGYNPASRSTRRPVRLLVSIGATAPVMNSPACIPAQNTCNRSGLTKIE